MKQADGTNICPYRWVVSMTYPLLAAAIRPDTVQGEDAFNLLSIIFKVGLIVLSFPSLAGIAGFLLLMLPNSFKGMLTAGAVCGLFTAGGAVLLAWATLRGAASGYHGHHVSCQPDVCAADAPRKGNRLQCQ